jgi:hypothetical protein
VIQARGLACICHQSNPFNTLLVVPLRKLRLALPRPIVVDVASAFLVDLGVFWYVSRSYA